MSTTLPPSLTDHVVNYATADILENLSRQLIRLMLARRYDDPCITQYLSPEIEAHWHLYLPTTGLPACRKILKNLDWRDCARDVLNSCAVAGDKEATVWLTTSALRTRLAHQSTIDHIQVLKLDWQRGRQGWVVVRQSSIRGPAFAGPF